jgi:hypothetical protein
MSKTLTPDKEPVPRKEPAQPSEPKMGTIIAKVGSTTVRVVPVPWYPPIQTTNIRPGVDPAQSELTFRIEDRAR